MKGTSALDAILACLANGKGFLSTELASETGLAQELVDEAVSFLVRYNLVRIAPNSSSVILRNGAMSPRVLAMILETLLSSDEELSSGPASMSC